MKKLIALCAIASVATAFAADDNVFGCLRVDSSAAETIVAVPWVAAGVTAGEIKVADIVKTANLNEGDELWWYNNKDKAYETWKLQNGEWAPMSMSAGMGEVEEAEDSTKRALSRGDALLLIRKAPIATCFYLYGQVPTSSAEGMTLGVGTTEAPCYTLIAPSSVTDTDINGAKWENVAPSADQIIIDGVGVFLYNGTEEKWGTMKVSFDEFKEVWTYPEEIKIPAGQGAWFVSAKIKKGEKTAASVQW